MPTLHLSLFSCISLGGLALFALIESYKAFRAPRRSADGERLSTLLIVLAGSVWVASLAESVLWGHRVLGDPVFIPTLGAILFFGGIGVRVLAFFTLGRHYNYMICVGKDHELVTWGIYSRIRHPLYLGTLLLFAGFPLMNQSLLGVILFIAVAVPAVAYRISVEEKLLLKAYPDTYVTYMKKTGRVLPFL